MALELQWIKPLEDGRPVKSTWLARTDDGREAYVWTAGGNKWRWFIFESGDEDADILDKADHWYGNSNSAKQAVENRIFGRTPGGRRKKPKDASRIKL